MLPLQQPEGCPQTLGNHILTCELPSFQVVSVPGLPICGCSCEIMTVVKGEHLFLESLLLPLVSSSTVRTKQKTESVIERTARLKGSRPEPSCTSPATATCQVPKEPVPFFVGGGPFIRRLFHVGVHVRLAKKNTLKKDRPICERFSR